MLLKSEKLKQIQKTLDDFKIECIEYITYKIKNNEHIQIPLNDDHIFITNKNMVYSDINVIISLEKCSINNLVMVCDYIHSLPLKNLK